jgi:hypothetical protein
MTAPQAAPPATARARQPWYVRPAVVLPIVASIVVIVALLTPQATTGRNGDARVSTYSTAPMGGRLFYETLRRLGWSVEQHVTRDWPADTDAIIAELAPGVPLRSTDVHALLERVRRGGALLVLLDDGSQLVGESLHVAVGTGRLRPRNPDGNADTQGCAAEPQGQVSKRILFTLWPRDQVTLSTLAWHGPPPDSLTPIVQTLPMEGIDRGRRRSAAVGFPYGRGRIVIGADPDLLRNDAIRVCKYGLDITAVRMVEYLGTRSDGTPRESHSIVFDEYRQGYGEHPGTVSAVASYLVSVASGRVLLQLFACGLILLVAAAPRAIPPLDPERIERRSPLEHVDALGRAYAQVGATRSAAARLVRGVRRRLAGGVVRPGVDTSDDAFLDRALRDAPQLAAEIALIKNALHSPVSQREFATLGAALEQLELSLTRI